jgi:hypothetical protein
MSEIKEIRMSEEIRKQMAGLLPMNNTATYNFTPESFSVVDEQYRPIFVIKQFNNEQILTVKELIFKDMDAKKKINIRELDAKNVEYMKILNTVIVSWTNLYDLGTGGLFEYDGKLETFMALPERIRTEIFTEALKISGFSGGI